MRSLMTLVLARDFTDEEKLHNLRRNLKDAASCLRALQVSGGLELTKGDNETNHHVDEIINILLRQPFQSMANQHAGMLDAIDRISHELEGIAENGEIDHSVVMDKLDGIEKNVTDSNRRLKAAESRERPPSNAEVMTESITNQPPAKAAHTAAKTQPKTQQESTTPPKPTISNPNSAHHPTRLVIQFLPDGIPQEGRMEATAVVEAVNRALSKDQRAKRLRVVAASYNHHELLQTATQSAPSLFLKAVADAALQIVLHRSMGVVNVVAEEAIKAATILWTLCQHAPEPCIWESATTKLVEKVAL